VTSTSTFTVIGFVPSVSIVMFRVDNLREGTLDMTYSLAVSSAISQSSSTCSEVSSGIPISSKRFHLKEVKSDANLVATSLANLSLESAVAPPVCLAR